MADKVVHPSTYDVIELVGTSSTSWEDAANNVIKLEASKHLRELRVAEVVKKDLVIRNGKVEAYRTRLKLSF